MKSIILKNKKTISGIVACLIICAIAMSFQTPFGPMEKVDSLTELQDTIPGSGAPEEKTMTIKDYDQLMLKMDKEISKMHEEINRIDLDKMHKDIAASLSKVDFDKIKLNIDKAINEVDFDKIERGVKTALQQIEWNKINDEVKKSLQVAKNQIEKIDLEAVKKEMENAKIEIEKAKVEVEKINFDELIKNANKEVVNAKEQLQLNKTMFNEMEKDGLIRQQEGFSIDYKNKTLLINGKKQPDAVREKYQKYIKGDSFRIRIGKE